MSKWSKVSWGVVMAALGLTFVYPLLWVLNTSLRSTEDFYRAPYSLPSEIIFANYPEALSRFDFLTYFSNSLLYTSVSCVIILLFGSMLAYFLARMESKWHRWIQPYIVMGIIIPSSVIIIPLYMMLNRMGLKNTRLGLIIVYSSFGIAGTVIMVYAFLRSLPRELEEAAFIDGCSIYGAFFRIIIPCIKPALFTRLIIEFMGVWNDYFLGYILTTSNRLKTLQVGLQGFFVTIGTAQWGQIGATMMISSLPVLILYLIFCEKIEHALTAGAILK